MARKRVKYQLEDNIKRVVRLNDGGDTTIINRDVTFATREETDAGQLTDKAIHPDGGGYAYDRLRWPNQHYAGKGTKDYSLAAVDGVVAVDCRKSNVFEYTATGDFTLANPVNGYSGQVINIKLIQDSVGGHEVTFGSAYQWVMGATPVMSTGPGSVDMISAQYRSSTGKWLCSYLPDFTGSGTGWGNLPEGPPGEDGQTILSGGGAPTGSTGVDGDFYLDTTAWEIYGPKTAGAWGSGTSIIGPTGPTGATGATGAAGADGVVQSIVAGSNVTVDDTDPANPIVSASGGGGGTPDTLTEWFDEGFYRISTSAVPPNAWFSSPAGAGATAVNAAVAGHPGVYRLNTGSTNTGYSRLFWEAGATGGHGQFSPPVAGQTLVIEALVKHSAVTSAAQDFTTGVGLRRSFASANSFMLIGTQYSSTHSTAVWGVVTQDSGGVTNTTELTASPVPTTNWHLLRLEMTSTGWEAFVDGTSIGTGSHGNLPDQMMTPYIVIVKQAGATNIAFDVDFIRIAYEISPARY